MIIRKAKLEDLEDVKDLNQKLFHHDNKFDITLDVKWPDSNIDYYKKRINGKEAVTFVAEDNGSVIGYLIASIIDADNYRNLKKIVELENMFVEESYRGKGVGKMLINEYMKWAKGKKIKRLRVIASAKNKKAIEVYRKVGFFDYNLVLEREI